jgi:hypothetical protein
METKSLLVVVVVNFLRDSLRHLRESLQRVKAADRADVNAVVKTRVTFA